MTTLSAVIITLNEALRIESCLASLRFCDEIVLVDSGSNDGTLDLARRFTDRLYVEPFKGDGPQKNSALDKTTGEWVLVVDGDEVVPPPLAEEIPPLFNAPVRTRLLPQTNHRPGPSLEGTTSGGSGSGTEAGTRIIRSGFGPRAGSDTDRPRSTPR